FAQDQAILVLAVGGGHAHEQQEDAHEHGRMVGEDHQAGEEQHVRITIGSGTAGVGVPDSAEGSRPSSRRKTNTTTAAFTATASAAFQPKWVSMKTMSQFHWPATISTGGAANGVSTPPIDTFTNRVPSSAYLVVFDTFTA